MDQLTLLDVAPLSLGIETAGGVMETIIPRNTPIPVQASAMFTTHTNSQQIVIVQVFEGERSMTKDNHLLGKFELSGIPPAPRGLPQIEVVFDIDENGILHVSAEDKTTGNRNRIRITDVNSGKLKAAAVSQMMKEAEAHKKEDEANRERAEARTALENYVTAVKNALGDKKVTEKMSQDDVDKLFEYSSSVLSWAETNPEATREELEKKLNELEIESQPVMLDVFSKSGGHSALSAARDLEKLEDID